MFNRISKHSDDARGHSGDCVEKVLMADLKCEQVCTLQCTHDTFGKCSIPTIGVRKTVRKRYSSVRQTVVNVGENADGVITLIIHRETRKCTSGNAF